MDAKKAIEDGGSYLPVMTDWRMKPDEADAKKMQKKDHWKDWEEETSDPVNGMSRGVGRVYKSKYRKTK